MGMLDDALDTADALLGDDPAAQKTQASPKPPLERGPALDVDDDGPAPAAAPQLENVLDQARVDFIHFGKQHADDGLRFAHPERDDRLGPQDQPEEELGRAMQYRAALQRETLLLHEHMRATRFALQEYEDSKGSLGAAAGMVMDAITGDAETDAPPQAAEIDLHTQDVSASGGYVNLAETKFEEVEKTGEDLHTWRADFEAFCKQCETYFIKKEGASGGKGIGGLLPEIPGVPQVIQDVQGYAFMAFDLYLGMYFACRRTFQTDIDAQVYDLSVTSLRENARPVFHIWFPEPPPQSGNGSGNAPSGSSPSNPVEEAIQDVKDKVDEVKQDIEDAKNDVLDFLGFEKQGPTCPGDGALDEIFRAFAGRDEIAGSKTLSQVFLESFAEIIGYDPPEFIHTVIEELTAANTELVKRVYRAVMMGRGSMPIDTAAMMRAGRETLADAIVDIAARLIPGLGFLNDGTEFLSMGSTKFGGDEIANLASRYLDQGLGDQLAKLAELSSGKLAPVLEDARMVAGRDGITMEPLLGRLPYVLALQFRNTFFPLIDLVLGAVFGAIEGPAGKALGAITGVIQDVKMAAKGLYDDAMGAYQDAMDMKDKAGKVMDNLSQTHDLTEVAKDPEGYAKGLLNTDEPGLPGSDGPEEAPPPAPFPGSDRLPKTKGLPLEEA
ncbi:MAG: hypothetical protein H6833_07160 [Planctomycetes bacterium]|nr:hypothetical protein [Planctomycetota bacterium]